MATKHHAKLLLLASALLCGPGSLVAQQVDQSPLTEPSPAPAAVEAAEPKTPAELPPTAPRVICQKEQLSIHAENATLGSILNAVQVCLGIHVEVPFGSSGQRVYTDLGPGSVRSVVASLLNGTDFDYAIGMADDDPQKVQKIVLMARATDGTSEVVAAGEIPADRSMTAARQAWAQNRQVIEAARAAGQAATESSSDTPAESGGGGEERTADVPRASEEEPTEAAAVSAPAVATPPPTSSASQSSSQTRDTGSRIADMQQMFEQRRQMIQSQRIVGNQPN